MASKAPTIRGLTGVLIRTRTGDVQYQQDGSFEGTCDFAVLPYSAALGVIPIPQVSTHPDFPNLICTDVRVTQDDVAGSSIGRVRATYRGPSGLAVPNSQLLIKIDPALTSKPITEHPDFATWAGTPTAPIGGIFDPSTQQFSGWNPNAGSGQDPNGFGALLFGVDAYYFAGRTVRRPYISPSAPDETRLGQLYSDITGYDNSDNSVFFMQGLSYRTLGRWWSVEEEYVRVCSQDDTVTLNRATLLYGAVN
jgi:hypothetical protein